MIMRTLFLSALLFASLPAASAQDTSSGSTTTGSGVVVVERTMEDIIASIRAAAPGRTPKRLKDVMVPEAKQLAWDTSLNTARARLADHRRECRASIRSANRDQLMVRASQCMRGDLLQDVNMQRDYLQYVSNIPLLNPVLKASLSGSIIRLTDAEMTIVNAIDTGLFEQISSLETAKKNLRLTYREPVWLGTIQVRADHELTWAIFMAKRIEERLTGLEPGTARALQLRQAAEELESGVLLLQQSIGAGDKVSAAQHLEQARLALIEARKNLSTVARRERLAEEEKMKELEAQ